MPPTVVRVVAAEGSCPRRTGEASGITLPSPLPGRTAAGAQPNGNRVTSSGKALQALALVERSAHRPADGTVRRTEPSTMTLAGGHDSPEAL
jgi:hypothetical protein